jgi:hypothetical protein
LRIRGLEVRKPWFMTRLKDVQHVSASQVAQLGACEYQIMLQARHGKRTTVAQALAIEEGTARHERFHEQGQRATGAPEAKRWCFVASAVYGEAAPQTELLRGFRDQVLRKSRMGRAAIGVYYRYSPSVALLIQRNATAARVVRSVLDVVIAGLKGLGLARSRQC